MQLNALGQLKELLFPSHETQIAADQLTYKELELLMHPKHAINATITLFPYRNQKVRSLLWQVKYYHNQQAVTLLGRVFASYIKKTYPEGIVVIPIPLSRRRLLERGYNQVNLVLKEATRHDKRIQIDEHMLLRLRHTPRQTELTRSKRLKNMQNAFRVKTSDLPKNTPLLLVDDVMTTGATLREAKKVLEKEGFQNVACIAIAH